MCIYIYVLWVALTPAASTPSASESHCFLPQAPVAIQELRPKWMLQQGSNEHSNGNAGHGKRNRLASTLWLQVLRETLPHPPRLSSAQSTYGTYTLLCHETWWGWCYLVVVSWRWSKRNLVKVDLDNDWDHWEIHTPERCFCWNFLTSSFPLPLCMLEATWLVTSSRHVPSALGPHHEDYTVLPWVYVSESASAWFL